MDQQKNGQGRYGISTLCRKTGLSPALLRAWEKRYGLLEPQRTEGGHRYYTDEDLRVLEQVSRMLDEGARIGEVAVLGRAELLARASFRPPLHTVADDIPEAEPDAIPTRLVTRLVEAAERYDAPSLDSLLDEVFARYSPLFVIRQVLQPAARRIGERWAGGCLSVASEHLFSGHLLRRLQRLVDWVPITSPLAPRALCACFPDENHEAGVLVVAYHLALSGSRVLYLGASLPLEDLERAMGVTHPQTVCLSVARRGLLQVHKPALLALVRRRGLGVRFLVGGAGAWPPDPDLEAAGVVVWAPERDLSELSGGLLSRN